MKHAFLFLAIILGLCVDANAQWGQTYNMFQPARRAPSYNQGFYQYGSGANSFYFQQGQRQPSFWSHQNNYGNNFYQGNRYRGTVRRYR